MHTLLGNPDADCVQMAQLMLYNGATALAIASVSNPGGKTPAAEGPDNVRDGSMDTKWLDFNKESLVLTLEDPQRVDGYSWATANDDEARDPVRWVVEGSTDGGSTWTELDSQSAGDDDVPRARQQMLPKFNIEQP